MILLIILTITISLSLYILLYNDSLLVNDEFMFDISIFSKSWLLFFLFLEDDDVIYDLI